MKARTTFLAKQDKHYVVLCQRNLVHLHWQKASLRLHPMDFVEMAEFLLTAKDQLQPYIYCGNDKYFVIEYPPELYMAWLMGLGLYIKKTEFQQLTALVDEALEQLSTQYFGQSFAYLFFAPEGDSAEMEAQTAFSNVCSVCQTTSNGKPLVQVNWSQISFCLSPSDFSQAVNFLIEAQPALEDEACFGGEQYYIERDEQGLYQVWLRGVGLYLSPELFSRFMDMLTQVEAQKSFASSHWPLVIGKERVRTKN